jgi:hypothetical protein
MAGDGARCRRAPKEEGSDRPDWGMLGLPWPGVSRGEPDPCKEASS